MIFRKLPVLIEAFKWTASHDQLDDPEWICEAIEQGKVFFTQSGTPHVQMRIKTLEGVMIANIGDWIIKGIKGELYPCKPDIFEATYEAVK